MGVRRFPGGSARRCCPGEANPARTGPARQHRSRRRSAPQALRLRYLFLLAAALVLVLQCSGPLLLPLARAATAPGVSGTSCAATGSTQPCRPANPSTSSSSSSSTLGTLTTPDTAATPAPSANNPSASAGSSGGGAGGTGGTDGTTTNSFIAAAPPGSSSVSGDSTAVSTQGPTGAGMPATPPPSAPAGTGAAGAGAGAPSVPAATGSSSSSSNSTTSGAAAGGARPASIGGSGAWGTTAAPPPVPPPGTPAGGSAGGGAATGTPSPRTSYKSSASAPPSPSFGTGAGEQQQPTAGTPSPSPGSASSVSGLSTAALSALLGIPLALLADANPAGVLSLTRSVSVSGQELAAGPVADMTVAAAAALPGAEAVTEVLGWQVTAPVELVPLSAAGAATGAAAPCDAVVLGGLQSEFTKRAKEKLKSGGGGGPSTKAACRPKSGGSRNTGGSSSSSSGSSSGSGSTSVRRSARALHQAAAMTDPAAVCGAAQASPGSTTSVALTLLVPADPPNSTTPTTNTTTMATATATANSSSSRSSSGGGGDLQRGVYSMLQDWQAEGALLTAADAQQVLMCVPAAVTDVNVTTQVRATYKVPLSALGAETYAAACSSGASGSSVPGVAAGDTCSVLSPGSLGASTLDTGGGNDPGAPGAPPPGMSGAVAASGAGVSPSSGSGGGGGGAILPVVVGVLVAVAVAGVVAAVFIIRRCRRRRTRARVLAEQLEKRRAERQDQDLAKEQQEQQGQQEKERELGGADVDLDTPGASTVQDSGSRPSTACGIITDISARASPLPYNTDPAIFAAASAGPSLIKLDGSGAAASLAAALAVAAPTAPQSVATSPAAATASTSPAALMSNTSSPAARIDTGGTPAARLSNGGGGGAALPPFAARGGSGGGGGSDAESAAAPLHHTRGRAPMVLTGRALLARRGSGASIKQRLMHTLTGGAGGGSGLNSVCPSDFDEERADMNTATSHGYNGFGGAMTHESTAGAGSRPPVGGDGVAGTASDTALIAMFGGGLGGAATPAAAAASAAARTASLSDTLARQVYSNPCSGSAEPPPPQLADCRTSTAKRKAWLLGGGGGGGGGGSDADGDSQLVARGSYPGVGYLDEGRAQIVRPQPSQQPQAAPAVVTDAVSSFVTPLTSLTVSPAGAMAASAAAAAHVRAHRAVATSDPPGPASAPAVLHVLLPTSSSVREARLAAEIVAAASPPGMAVSPRKSAAAAVVAAAAATAAGAAGSGPAALMAAATLPPPMAVLAAERISLDATTTTTTTTAAANTHRVSRTGSLVSSSCNTPTVTSAEAPASEAPAAQVLRLSPPPQAAAAAAAAALAAPPMRLVLAAGTPPSATPSPLLPLLHADRLMGSPVYGTLDVMSDNEELDTPSPTVLPRPPTPPRSRRPKTPAAAAQAAAAAAAAVMEQQVEERLFHHQQQPQTKIAADAAAEAAAAVQAPAGTRRFATFSGYSPSVTASPFAAAALAAALPPRLSLNGAGTTADGGSGSKPSDDAGRGSGGAAATGVAKPAVPASNRRASETGAFRPIAASDPGLPQQQQQLQPNGLPPHHPPPPGAPAAAATARHSLTITGGGSGAAAAAAAAAAAGRFTSRVNAAASLMRSSNVSGSGGVNKVRTGRDVATRLADITWGMFPRTERLATKRASGALVPASPVRASAGSQLSGGSGSGCGTPAAGAAAAADSPNAHLRSVLKHTPGIKRASLSGTSLGAAPVAAPSPVPPLHSGREGAILDVRISSSAAGPAGANGGGGAGTSGDAAAGPRLEFLVRWSGSATVSHDAVVAATAGAAGAAAAAAAAGVWPPAPAARPALVEWVPTEGVPSKAVLKRFMGGSPRWAALRSSPAFKDFTQRWRHRLPRVVVVVGEDGSVSASDDSDVE
ncbi:hypothetical protein CHLRE_17g732400v5 [Chlamydomonas reinhardtii]|uniref:Uncharacterized protein n=1 Tax=Chlamydomonas reinhardtii TaxID=3055 RepID=A0A2K3CR39_CHLRE|nr:uncharacterized protein CHLRE_17g732400v5 [Chlamydomonas reinhardtii]PNW70735.1 hypothetical protein CHLRE_17g732400v5 [Chlamydomonas reinhardtii]